MLSAENAQVAKTVSRNSELEAQNASLRQLLEISRNREKGLVMKLEGMGHDTTLDLEYPTEVPFKAKFGTCPLEPETSFLSSLLERGGWLIGLLAFQSCSSFILASHEELLQDHPSIVYFLTMLVGAGGNAGNQAAVRVIRGIAVGTVNASTRNYFIFREFLMACSLSALLGVAGIVRTLLSAQTSLSESFAICVSLMTIVFISIMAGSVLPLLLQACRIDPAHSSTTIQVIMDISGVLITCTLASTLLDSSFGQMILAPFGL
jgi:Mg/Co/Ni transporter MgtE